MFGKNFSKLARLAALFGAMALPAMAEVNVSGGLSYFGLEDQDQNHVVAHVRADYFFNAHLGLEAELSHGLNDFEESTVVSLDPVSFVPADATLTSDLDFGWGAFAKARWAVGEKAKVFVRAGYAEMDSEDTFRVPVASFERSQGGTVKGPAYGAGVMYGLTEKWSGRLDYTRYDFDAAGNDLPCYTFALTASYGF